MLWCLCQYWETLRNGCHEYFPLQVQLNSSCLLNWKMSQHKENLLTFYNSQISDNVYSFAQIQLDLQRLKNYKNEIHKYKICFIIQEVILYVPKSCLLLSWYKHTNISSEVAMTTCSSVTPTNGINEEFPLLSGTSSFIMLRLRRATPL